MGVINLTDDSFSGDGFCGEINQAIDYGFRLVEQGAHLLDLGAESSRPGAESVPEQQELDRVIPVLEGLRSCGVPGHDLLVPLLLDASRHHAGNLATCLLDFSQGGLLSSHKWTRRLAAHNNAG
jgi:dihydropteroate synthase